MQNRKAFTLIELIVWVTISIILMVSVSMFVSTWIQNILTQEKVLNDNPEFIDGMFELQNTLKRMDTSFTWSFSSTGAVFKVEKEFNKWGFAFVWEYTGSWTYCRADSEDPNTKHLWIKNFIPFYEEGEVNFIDTLTGSVTDGTDTYISSVLDHTIRKNGTIIIGREVSGSDFTQGDLWTDLYLNSPTGLAHDGINLYISDTLNHRILYTTGSTVHTLLDSDDWLVEPTGLYFNAWQNALYISNSGKWEILKYSSKSIINNDTLNITLTPHRNILDIDRMNIEIPENINIPSFVFSTNIINWDDYLTGALTNLDYYFADFTPSFWSPEIIGECLWSSDITTYYFSGTTPKKKIIDCINTWSWKISDEWTSLYTNFSSGAIYDIDISNISDNLSPWTHHVKIWLYNWNTLEHEEYFPYFVNGDNDLSTPNDNTLTQYASGLKYPTGIWNDSGLQYPEFDIATFPISDFVYTPESDILMNSPIESIEFDKISTPDLLSTTLKYYRVYNCYNLDDRNEKTFIQKTNLR